MTKNHPNPDVLGHRQRLRQSFMLAPKSCHDYELIEMILFASIPRRDVKSLAKRLLAEFGDIAAIIHAPMEKLKTIEGISDNVSCQLRLIAEIMDRTLEAQLLDDNILSSWNALIDYLRMTMGNAKTEQFRILYLNKKNKLIANELQAYGTVDCISLYPREVVKRALFHEATAIILVHNHPSGNEKPSIEDINLTKEIVSACKIISVTVHDHVIICKNNFFSFKTNLLL